MTGSRKQNFNIGNMKESTRHNRISINQRIKVSGYLATLVEGEGGVLHLVKVVF